MKTVTETFSGNSTCKKCEQNIDDSLEHEVL